MLGWEFAPFVGSRRVGSRRVGSLRLGLNAQSKRGDSVRVRFISKKYG